jgi:hypothetical protein
MNHPDNFSRQFLVTKFACASCGASLKLSYEPDVKPKRDHAPGQPSGAEMLESVISLEPCRCVVDRLERMQSAARVLLGESEGRSK